MKCSDEISIGEYVRTKLGDIKKITKGFEFVIERYNESANKIVKHSKDIKNLLQIGDIIITNNLCGEITKIDGDTIYLANYMGTCKVEDIKSIITKEQIKQIEFRIKE